MGIPTIADRCQQALYALSLIPVSEVTADLNSYRFRPQRCCADAITQTHIVLSKRVSPQWILEGDIKGCFDHISHAWMIDNLCMDKVFRKARSTTQADLIKTLNPKLRGWANYHRSVVAKETFSKTGHQNKGWLTTGLSRMIRKYHVWFLGGKRLATTLATRCRFLTC